MMQRRGFLAGILAAGMAPVYVPLKSLMVPPRQIWTPPEAFEFVPGYAQCEPVGLNGGILHIYSGGRPPSNYPGPPTGMLLATLSVPSVDEWMKLTDLPIRIGGAPQTSGGRP